MACFCVWGHFDLKLARFQEQIQKIRVSWGSVSTKDSDIFNVLWFYAHRDCEETPGIPGYWGHFLHERGGIIPILWGHSGAFWRKWKFLENPAKTPKQLASFPQRRSFTFCWVYFWDAVFFAYSWKFPAYSGASSLTIDNFSRFTYNWSFF